MSNNGGLRKVSTPLGELYVEAIDVGRVQFFHAKDFRLAPDNLPGFTINGVRMLMRVEVVIDEEGRARITKGGRSWETAVPLDSPNLVDAIDARRTDSREIVYRPKKGSPVARRLIIAQVLPGLVEVARGMRAECAAVGVAKLLREADSEEARARQYEGYVTEARKKAQDARDKAKAIRDRDAWAADAVEAVRAPEGV